MRLSVTWRRPGGVGQPPARLRGTMENASTGQMRSSNPPPACGGVVPGSADLGSESGLTERRTLPNRWAPECAFPSRRDRRMRFSVRVPAQNALFRRMRFSSPAQTSSHLTEKRILRPTTYVKTHSMPQRTYRAHFFVRDVARVHLYVISQSQSALFGEGL